MPGRAIGLKWFGIDKAERTLKVSLAPPALVRPTAESQGWAIASPVPGYRPMNCYLRGSEAVLQCIFSDGLASVSVFVEPWDAKRHAQEGVRRLGATQTLTRRLVDPYWAWRGGPRLATPVDYGPDAGFE